jgi:hypothetical protein
MTNDNGIPRRALGRLRLKVLEQHDPEIAAAFRAAAAEFELTRFACQGCFALIPHKGLCPECALKAVRAEGGAA